MKKYSVTATQKRKVIVIRLKIEISKRMDPLGWVRKSNWRIGRNYVKEMQEIDEELRYFSKESEFRHSDRYMLVYITHGTSSKNTDSGVALLRVSTRPHGQNPGFQKEARPNAVPLKEHKPARVTVEATRNDRSLEIFIGLYRADLHQSIPHGSADGISRKFVQCFIQSE